ncbi:MAG: GNAT family N-acetyltransferase [Clostridia bacterium]|nr:GNAT family N-acetyltransferase [Clostridia bacterium]
MEIRFLGNSLSDEIKEDFWKIVCLMDNDFVPPLSSRESSYQKGFSKEKADNKVLPVKYFEALCEQQFILATVDGKTAGFLSYKTHYTCDALGEINDSLYITTICILPEMRNRGISKRLYEEAESVIAPEEGYDYVTTRTWSTNEAQMHLLPLRGYDKVAVLKDDRGEGIDTVYFAKKIR